MQAEIGPFIDGRPARSASARAVEVINPSTGRGLLWIPAGDDADASKAVASARRAFDDGRWSEAPPSFRKNVLLRFSELIAAEAQSLDLLDAGEMGKAVAERLFSAAAASALMRFHAESVDKVLGDVYVSDRGSFVAQRVVPRGVIAAITPWNFPTYNVVLKIAPALAAGNCLVVKPSELASRSALRLAELAIAAQIPPGVLNVVPGLGDTVGRALALHRDVDMIAFTGSTEVGKLVMQYAGQSNMKVVLAECGGKSPHIVFDDGLDLGALAEKIARPVLTNQGQICSVGSRLIVHRSIESELIERIATVFESVTIGDASDPKTTFGPLASATQCRRVMGYIDRAAAHGARRITGGRRTLENSGGYFVEPTLFCDVSPNAEIAQQEIFGPVLVVIPFDDEEQAVHIANDTVYGLSATVWTTDVSTGMRTAKRIRSSVRINAAVPAGEGAGAAAAYEPSRQSGIGVEGGLAGMASYLRRQVISINHA